MKCITSPALDDVQILSFIEGEAEDSVVAHMKDCPYCSQKASQWTSLQNRLRKQVYRVMCPTPTELGDYHLGYLPDPQELVVAQHVRECALCEQELEALENFLSSLTPETSLLGAAKVLVARLISSQNNFAPALRGEGKELPTFEANGIVIVLDIQPTTEGRANIFGQVAADNQDQWTGASVELRKDNQLESITEVDDLGVFQCENIHLGRQELIIRPKTGPVVIVQDF